MARRRTSTPGQRNHFAVPSGALVRLSGAARKHYLVLNDLDSDRAVCAPAGLHPRSDDPNGFVAAAATLAQQTTDSLERIQNDMVILGGSSVLSGFNFDYHGSYAVGSDR